MSGVPPEIPGLGSSAMKLRISSGFDPLKAQVGPDEYFLLSRIDGHMTIREVLLATGLPVERGIAIVVKLRSIGALLLPGETQAPPPATAPTRAAPPGAAGTPPARAITPPRGTPAPPQPQPPQRPVISRTTTPAAPMPGGRMPAKPGPFDAPTARGTPFDPPTARGFVDPATQRGPHSSDGAVRPPARPSEIDPPTAPKGSAEESRLDLRLLDPTGDEIQALSEHVDLDDTERRRILAMERLVRAHNPWGLLGVAQDADARALKRSYFKLSKEIHPDRFYGRQLGSFAGRLAVVFEAVSRAYAKLTGSDKGRGSGGQPAVHHAEQPQTPGEYAAELFDRACSLEVRGDALGAMKLFAAAVRIDPQTRYLRRAATCALAAEQPKTALEYAKKAQAQALNDPSAARLLASAFRAAGRLGDAEEVLVMAMALKSENDTLTAELRNDLAEVRRLLGG